MYVPQHGGPTASQRLSSSDDDVIGTTNHPDGNEGSRSGDRAGAADDDSGSAIVVPLPLRDIRQHEGMMDAEVATADSCAGGVKARLDKDATDAAIATVDAVVGGASTAGVDDNDGGGVGGDGVDGESSGADRGIGSSENQVNGDTYDALFGMFGYVTVSPSKSLIVRFITSQKRQLAPAKKVYLRNCCFLYLVVTMNLSLCLG